MARFAKSNHWTDRYIGLPYDEANCAELCARVAREVLGRSVTIPVPGEGRGRDFALLSARFAEFSAPVTAPADGDIVVLRHGGARLWHVGAFARIGREPWVLHTTSRVGMAHLTRMADLPRFGLSFDGYYRWI